ncbi:MAG: membrane dipeptidase [Caldilineaceae bacterium]
MTEFITWEEIANQVEDFHRRHPICDMIGLNLTHPRFVIENVDLGARHDETCRGDFVKFKAWGIHLVLCKGGPVWYDPNYRSDWLSQMAERSGREDEQLFLGWGVRHPTQLVLAILDRFLLNIEANLDKVYLVQRLADLDNAENTNKVGLLMGLNSSTWFGDSPGVLRMFARLGLRHITLAISGRELGYDGYDEIRSGGKLTTLGVRLLEEMNNCGILVDISHLNDPCSLDVIELSDKPVIASHSNPRCLSGSLRDIPDEIMLALAQKGGLLGIMPPISRPPGAPPTGAGPMQRVARTEVEQSIHLIRYAVNRMGVDHVGIGTHFNSAALPWLTIGLLDAGFSEAETAKIMGGNYLRVMRSVLPS